MSGRLHLHHPISIASTKTQLIGLGLISITIILIVYIGHINFANNHNLRYSEIQLEDDLLDDDISSIVADNINGNGNLDQDFEATADSQSLQAKLENLDQKYKSLFEYKERLEKAYLNLKNEKASLIQQQKTEKMEFNELKELYTKQVQTLHDDLKICKDQLQSFILNHGLLHKPLSASSSGSAISGAAAAGAISPSSASSSNNGKNEPESLIHIPVLSAPANNINQTNLQQQHSVFDNNKSAVISQNSMKSNLFKSMHSSIVSNVLKEPIQSPIAQVPNEPAQPSSDPNQDLVGNVLI